MSIFAIINCFIAVVPIVFAFRILYIFDRNYLDVGLLTAHCLGCVKASFSVPSPLCLEVSPVHSSQPLLPPPSPTIPSHAMVGLLSCVLFSAAKNSHMSVTVFLFNYTGFIPKILFNLMKKIPCFPLGD